MPRRALRCIVNLNIRAVSAPGVWLSSREDCYLSISLFGQYRNTSLVPSIFPLLLKEEFVFEKTYYTALDPSDVSDYLEDELVIFELLQLSEYSSGAVRLASYSCNAKDFLFPYPSLAPCYASTSREILLNRTIDFPGISPKLEFVTISNIKESVSPELDALDDALQDARRARRRSRSRSRSRPSSRASMRSPSPSPYIRSKSPAPAPVTDDGRPPFVVRHLDDKLIGRLPAGIGGSKNKKGKRKSGKRRSRPSSALSDTGYYSDYADYSRPSFSSSYKKYRDAGDDPIYKSSASDDEDLEVAALTSSLSKLRPRSRSPSPFVYKPTFRSRYTYSPLTPAERVDLKVRSALRRNRSLERLNALSPALSLSSLYRARSPYYYLYDSLDDLAVDTSLAKTRRYYY